MIADHPAGNTGSGGAYGGQTARSGSGALFADFAGLKGGLDGLLARISAMSEDDMKEAIDRLMTGIDAISATATQMTCQTREQVRHGVDATSDYVKEKPLQAVGIAAAAGLLLGMLMSRR
jgi:ElaB/YqjD/DUF883 family membrane-anchored ribosome-binding protein